MGRSLKKGPFADEHLMKKVEAQQGAEKKKVIKTWSRRSTIFQHLLDLQLPYMMDVNTFLYTSKKTW